MKKYSLPPIAAVLFAAPVFAADMPVEAPLSEAPPPVCLWCGFYIGGNLGYSWGTATDAVAFGGPNIFTGAIFANPSEHLTGPIGGGQVGYNWVVDNRWLLGVEADIQASGEKGIGVAPLFFATGAPIVGGSESNTDKLRWFSTLRGRIGFTTDRWMVYGTGGVAWLNESASTTVVAVPPIVPWCISDHDQHVHAPGMDGRRRSGMGVQW